MVISGADPRFFLGRGFYFIIIIINFIFIIIIVFFFSEY